MNNRMKKLLAAVLIVILPLNALPASASEITPVHPDPRRISSHVEFRR